MSITLQDKVHLYMTLSLHRHEKDDQAGTRAYSNKLSLFKDSVSPNRLNDVYRASYES